MRRFPARIFLDLLENIFVEIFQILEMDRNGFEGISWGYTILHDMVLGKIIKNVMCDSGQVVLSEFKNFSHLSLIDSYKFLLFPIK